jgi:2,3-dihydro-2,3-dihydroxybenzoate dehydrogenase
VTGIDGRIAVVTGAAGGIGAAVVARLAAAGARVAGFDIAPLAAAAASVPMAGAAVWSAPLDVRDARAVDVAMDRVEGEMGPIDLAVNVAGVLSTGLLVETGDAAFRQAFEVNAFGVFHLSRAVARRMLARGRGSIVTVSSNAAGIPRHGMGAYAASKAAASMLTCCLALELAPYGIRCNNVAPGSTRTAMLSSMLSGDATERDVIAGSPATFKTGIPLGKLAEPADVANAVLFLLSDEAGHIAGTDLYVDGGAAQRA